ncbi:MAG: tetratricopeptide repeat protein [Desulfuromonadales bacterium]
MKRSRGNKKSGNSVTSKGKTTRQEKPSRLPLWQAILLPVVSVLVFLLLLEGGLALVGVSPVVKTEDPFVGFAANVPLYVPDPEAPGTMVTARNKNHFFNRQIFTRDKSPDTYRIFTLGGSTTYGRPYKDATSFSGWLRELLPRVDGGRKWEVINAGGISYASYRVAHLMEELIRYQPDLFIVYTGHNEFLEERTYGQIKEIAPLIRSTVGLLSRTRTWSAMTTALQGMGMAPKAAKTGRDQLAGEVKAILDQSAGLERYTRDDPLREKILEHYRLSLERMAALARSVGAQIIFVTPASNLKDCTPFKSEHTVGLNPGVRQQSEELLVQGKAALDENKGEAALVLLDRAIALDPRYAELHYRRGQALLALGRFGEAAEALRRARDEDVCPLRALTPMRRIVTEVAREQGVKIVDYVDLLEAAMRKETGHPIAGQEFFLDHVHPTIEGHKMLAVKLVRAMTEAGSLRPVTGWEEQAVAAATASIEAKVDEAAHALALANLARVLLWAGKDEEAARLAKQARATTDASEQVLVSSTSILTSILLEKGNSAKALDLLYETLAVLPGAIEIRMKLGLILLGPEHREQEESAANLLLVCQQMPDHDAALTGFSQVMAQRGRLGIAYDAAAEALRFNPKNGRAGEIQAQIRTILKGRDIKPTPFHVELEGYPSRAPRKLVQMRRISGGRVIPHGIEVEFHENGRLKSFKDLVGGKLHGLAKTWDAQGKELTRTVYKQGVPVAD